MDETIERNDYERRTNEKSLRTEGHTMTESIKTWKRDGFTLTAELEPDPEMEPGDYLGNYCTNPDIPPLTGDSEQVFKVPPVRTRGGFLLPGMDEGAYYRPQKGSEEHWEEDERRLRDFYLEQWSFVGVRVTAEKAGVVLGRDTRWGVESDSSMEHFEEIMGDCEKGAIARAKAKLKELCGGD